MDVSLVPAFDALGEGCLARSRLGGKIIRSKTEHTVGPCPDLLCGLGNPLWAPVPLLNIVSLGQESPIPPGSVVLVSGCSSLAQATAKTFLQPLPRTVLLSPSTNTPKEKAKGHAPSSRGLGQGQNSAKSCLLS